MEFYTELEYALPGLPTTTKRFSDGERLEMESTIRRLIGKGFKVEIFRVSRGENKLHQTTKVSKKIQSL